MAGWKLRSKHEWEFGSALPGYGKAGCTFVGGLAVTAIGITAVVMGAMSDAPLGPILFGGGVTIFGLIPLALGLFLFPWNRIAWVKVYEQGLRWKCWGREYERRWEEVKRVNQSEVQAIDVRGDRNDWYSSATLWLHFDDGTTVSFDTALSDFGRLARHVQEEVAARKRP